MILRLAALLLVALLGACATPRGSVVLLPEPDGKPTAVTITQGKEQATLDQPYAAARLTDSGPKPFQSNAQEVQAQFGAALAARPLPPAQFTLYFVEGKDEFTAESKKIVDDIFGEIARRPVPDVVVIGHTDTMGNDVLNDALSRQRAEVVRKALIARGIPPDRIVATGRGKRELAVPTADNVSEPRNRRVEILVR